MKRKSGAVSLVAALGQSHPMSRDPIPPSSRKPCHQSLKTEANGSTMGWGSQATSRSRPIPTTFLLTRDKIRVGCGQNW